MFYPKGRYCNAGFNAGVIDSDGTVRVCHELTQVIGNAYEKIEASKLEELIVTDSIPLSQESKGTWDLAEFYIEVPGMRSDD